jgi:hypothetical protein
MSEFKPFEQQDILEKLKIRAEIRRRIGKTSDGKPDRIADTCEGAYEEIVRLRERVAELEELNDKYAVENSELLTRIGW